MVFCTPDTIKVFHAVCWTLANWTTSSPPYGHYVTVQPPAFLVRQFRLWGRPVVRSDRVLQHLYSFGRVSTFLVVSQGFTNSGCLNFNRCCLIFSALLLQFLPYIQNCASDDMDRAESSWWHWGSQVSPHYRSSKWNLLHDSLPVPRIWNRLLIFFLEICGPLRKNCLGQPVLSQNVFWGSCFKKNTCICLFYRNLVLVT